MANREKDVVDAASASSSSCAAVPPKIYHVFISFRGEDTRCNFVSHLHAALKREEIVTYIDNRIDKGDEVWPALVTAIEKSSLFLIVFSENYASSTWCLNELTKIFECTQNQDHRVLPIFYKTDPSHLRKPEGTYRLAFERHEISDQKQHVQKWRAALSRAAAISGWPCGVNTDEAALIQDIIKRVLKLVPKYTSESSGHVGVQERIAYLESLLFCASEDVRYIGIWGMGGIGKTTLATEVFKRLRFEYEGCYFLANVREESQRLGINQLRHELLSTLLDDADPHVGMPHEETSNMMRRLSQKKVLIVLDDVDDADQIEKLAGSRSCFGRGSRIIVTTRDKQVIKKDADVIYEVQALSCNEALQLFNLKAFKDNSMDRGFEQLCKKVAGYTKGNPLAIKVLASLLCGKGEREWESQLEKLQKMPCQSIQSVLRLSYDGLDHEEKNIFLDVACFFKGRRVEDIKPFFDACGYSTIIGLERLKDKALLTISDAYVWMHDLIQEMGKGIVREESIEDPEKRSRLWDHNDVYQVLKSNVGNEAIRGITLDLSKIIGDLYLNPCVFGRMRKLKLLKIYNSIFAKQKVLHFSEGLESLPNELRCLHWDAYPLKSLPPTFSAEKLVSLQLKCSEVTHLWHGTQNLVNLKDISLYNCQRLIELPDFSKAQLLERVNLWACKSLQFVHPSIFSLDKLEVLNLGGCKSITRLRSDVHLKSLRFLYLWECTRLEEFSVVSENMFQLDLGRTAIDLLPSSLGNLSRLDKLELRNCIRLKNLPDKLGDLQSLSELNIDGCTQLNTSNLHCIFNGLQSLKRLSLRGCCNLSKLPDNISRLSSLVGLTMSGTSVQSLPTRIKHLSKLEILYLEYCRKLHFLPELPPSIKILNASDCISLVTVEFTSTEAMPLTSDWIMFDFQNCLQLQECSLKAIRASAMLRISRLVPAKNETEDVNSTIIYPGSTVPNWFEYMTRKASITTEISSTPHSMDWGFILCAIVPLFTSVGVIWIYCEAYEGDGHAVDECIALSTVDIQLLTSDHVVIWYDEGFCVKLRERIQRYRTDEERTTSYSKISFKFKAQYEFCEDGENISEHYDLEIKECGVCPTYSSKYKDFMIQTELEFQTQESASEMEVGSSNENRDEKRRRIS